MRNGREQGVSEKCVTWSRMLMIKKKSRKGSLLGSSSNWLFIGEKVWTREESRWH